MGRLERWLADHLGANRAVLALSLARMGDGIGNSILIIVIPLYVAKLPAPWFPLPRSLLVGILIALFGLVNSAAQPVTGALIDRFGRRKVFIQVGLLAMAAATLGFIAADRYLDLMLLRVLQGVGFALTITASIALLKDVTEERTRGGSMGVFTAFRMAGFAIGPLLGGWLQVRYGFPMAFGAGAAFIVVAMAGVHFWVAEPEREESGGAPGTESPEFRIFDPDLLTGALVTLGFATFVMAAGISMMSSVENEFNRRLSETAIGFGLAFSALTLSRLVFQIPIGRLSDRIGRKPVILAGLLALAPGTAALGLAATTWQLTGIRFFQGIASAGVAAPAFALAADMSTTGGEGRQLSVLTMGFGLGIAVGPLLSGFLAVVSFELPFLIGGGLALLSAYLVWRQVPGRSEADV